MLFKTDTRRFAVTSVFRSIITFLEDAKIFIVSFCSFTLTVLTDETANLRVSVLDSNGQLIAEKIYSKPSYRMTVPVETGTGAYIVRVSDNNGKSVVKKVML